VEMIMTTPLQNDRPKPFYRELEEAWNKLCEDRPWVPRMEISPTSEELLVGMKDEFFALSACDGTGPIRCSRMHFAEWAEILSNAIQEMEATRLAKLNESE
jgi:hypothetical protein